MIFEGFSFVTAAVSGRVFVVAGWLRRERIDIGGYITGGRRGCVTPLHNVSVTPDAANTRVCNGQL